MSTHCPECGRTLSDEERRASLCRHCRRPLRPLGLTTLRPPADGPVQYAARSGPLSDDPSTRAPGDMPPRGLRETIDDPFRTSDEAAARRLEGVWGKSLTESTSISSTLLGPRPEHSQDPTAPPLRLRVVRDARLGGPDLQSGETAADEAAVADADYELLHLLGEGGMGVVYAARQTTVDRTIAVKMLKPAAASDALARKKFLAEAAVTGDLDHPNIVPIHDLGASDDGAVFYAMKRVRGRPWQEAMATLSTAENLEILLRTADAVAFAHARGVIHRDLKPDNVMLGDFGEVLVMDWGLAASIGPGGKAHAVRLADSAAGTPAYMAPEMAVGAWERIGPLSDVYLLGAILFEIVAGKPPHTGNSVMQCMFAAGRNVIVPTDARGELLEVALAAMATAPEARPQSVQEFQQRVRDYRFHAESIHLTERAQEQLELARRDDDYNAYSQALFGFREAAAVWPQNEAALRGTTTTQQEFAAAAFQRGDLDLALQMLHVEVPEHAALRAQVEAARVERDDRRRRMQFLRAAAAGLAALLCVTLSIAFLWIRSARDAALSATAAAHASEREARAAQEEVRGALLREQEASLAAKQAAEEAREALVRENLAHDQSQRQLAQVFLDRGDHAFRELGYEGALVWYWRAYDVAPAGDPLRRSALELLSAVRPYAPKRLYHVREVRAAGFVGEDGAVAVTGSLQEGELRRWNGYTGEPLGPPFARGGRMVGVAFSRDGKTAATWGLDDAVRLWDVESGAPIGDEIPHGSTVRFVDFAPDGKRLATESGDLVRFWDVATGDPAGRSPPPLQSTTVVLFGPAGNLLLSAAASGRGQLWDGGADALRGGEFQHGAGVTAGAFRADGSAALTWGRDRTLRSWDAATGRPTGAPLHVADAERAAISPDGRILFTGDVDGGASFRDAATGALLAEPEWRNGPQTAFAFTPDGRRTLVGGLDGGLWVWDAVRRKPLPTSWKHDGAIVAGAFSRDGARMTASDQRAVMKSVERGASSGVARLWNVEPRRARRVVFEGAQAAVDAYFDAQGKRVATIAEEGGRAQLWEFPSGRPLGGEAALGKPPVAAALSADGVVLAAADESEVRLWDLTTSQPLPAALKHDGVRALAFTSDGRALASAGADQTVRFWDVRTGAARGEPLQRSTGLISLAYDRAGKTLLVGCGDRVAGRPHFAQSFDVSVAPPKPLGAPLRCDDALLAAALSPDGTIAVTSSADRVVRLWTTETGKPQGEPLLHDAPAQLVQFSPDGRTLLTASGDGVAQWWDVVSGCRLGGEWRHDARILALSLAADGRSAATIGREGAALLVRLPSPLPDQPELLRVWTELRTCLSLHPDDERRPLSREEWFKRWADFRAAHGAFLDQEAAEERAAAK